MGNPDSTKTAGTLARLSTTLTDGASALMTAFADKATPEDMLRLGQLLKETREGSAVGCGVGLVA